MAPLPPGVRLRDAAPSDAEAIHALYLRAYDPRHDPHRARIGVPFKDALEDVRGYLRERALLVAEDERTRELVGSVQLRAIANVRRLAVDPSRRGARLGESLLDAAVERARRERFDFAMLETLAEHPWLSPFYARRGFVERGIETLPDGSRWLVMRQRL